MIVPGFYFVVTAIALSHHLQERPFSDPPYMELSLLLLFLAGARLVWRLPPKPDVMIDANGLEIEKIPGEPKKGQAGNEELKNEERVKEELRQENRRRCRKWFALVWLFFLLTIISALGWWATEVAYAEEVIYSYNSPVAPAAPK
jgi:hypothetical protein